MTPYMTRCLFGILALTLLAGCKSYRDPDQESGMLGAPVEIRRSSLGFDYVDDVNAGILMPNASGDTMMIKGKEQRDPNPRPEEAYELKLKARELAAQMLETRDNQALVGLVAMPTSFVNLDNLSESTPLGRYLGEAMFYEFNQRNFPVREYRLTGAVALREGEGEIALSRSLPPIPTNQSWAALIIGTYQRDKAAVLVHVRMVRPSDGMVLRTGHMVLPMNSLLNRMTTRPPKPVFESGSSHISAK